MEHPNPTLDDVRAARERLGDRVHTTPLWRWSGREIAALAPDTDVLLKLELFQVTGTFKPRGALLNALALDPAARGRGLTAVSAGNHAIAVSFTAHQLGTSAKVVMPKKANPARVDTCRAWGAEVVLVDDVHQAFAEVERIRDEEGRAFIHPFEGERTTLGTATLGWEIAEQADDDLDAVIVPIGGGGLAAGIACAVKQARPRCAVYGVEPVGADTMHRSFAAGSPQKADRLDTIADSLAAPHAGAGSFALCRRYLDDVVLVDDEALRRAMALLFREMKLAVEPAGAAATAALTGPLADRLRGKKVALVVCGTNTDLATFTRLAAVDA